MTKMVDKTALFESAWFGRAAPGVEDWLEAGGAGAEKEELAEILELLGNGDPVGTMLPLAVALGVALEGKFELGADLLQIAF
jgi:hypothetical protein